jgi:hypothetical protein
VENVSVQVSVGELADKITILRIKSRKIVDPRKLANITKELNVLEAVFTNLTPPVPNHLVDELEAVNLKLWDIEDHIRDKERAKLFDQEFITLARAVYVTNDHRFEVKAKINDAVGSKLREEKSYQPY